MATIASIRTDTYAAKPGKRPELVAHLLELEGILNLGIKVRVFVSDTGRRNTVVQFMESENPGDLFQRGRNAAPGATAAWLEKLDELIEPGSWDSQVWAEKD